MINRSDIGGFEFKVFGYIIEIVTLKKIPCTIAISDNFRMTKKRLDILKGGR